MIPRIRLSIQTPLTQAAETVSRQVAEAVTVAVAGQYRHHDGLIIDVSISIREDTDGVQNLTQDREER